MSPSAGQRKDESVFVLVVDENPVRFNVAVAMSRIVTVKRMVFILWWQFASLTQNVNYIEEFVHVIAALLEEFVVLFEAGGIFDFEHCLRLQTGRETLAGGE